MTRATFPFQSRGGQRRGRSQRRVGFAVVYAGLCLGLGSLALSPQRAVRAQQGGDTVSFSIRNPGQSLYKIAVAPMLGDSTTGAALQEVTTWDLNLSGFFRTLDPRSFLADPQKEDLGMNPETWRSVNAEGVIKGRVTVTGGEAALDMRLYEVVKGGQPVLQKTYRGSASEVRRLGHQFAADVVKYFTGEDSFFNSQIAFAQGSGKQTEIAVMDWDGAGAHHVTSNGSINMLPSWHPGGGSLLYTTFVRGTPDLFSIGIGGGRGTRISTRPGLNTGGVFSPDGGKIAVTLSHEGNSEIYLLSPSGDILRRLTQNLYIDSTPTWSPDGSQIAFVSDRYGTPQIWVMSASGAGQAKLTKRGNFNTEPAWAPRKINDKSLIAFSGRDERGSFDVFTVDASSGEIARLTENRGSNLHPTWAPTARAIAYQSSRGGVWVATGDGKTEHQVFRGAAQAPVWGPTRK